MESGKSDTSAATIEDQRPAEVEDARCGGQLDEENKGWKMLVRMGWKRGTGLGFRENGEPSPMLCVEDQNGSKGLGLRHISDRCAPEPPKVQNMESWEIEEKTQDFFRGSKSSMWVSAGHLPTSEDMSKTQAPSAPSSSLITYRDGWNDRPVSESVPSRGRRRPGPTRPAGGGNDDDWGTGAAGRAAAGAWGGGGGRGGDEEEEEEPSWEDTWAEHTNTELDAITVSAEHFFACCVIHGSMVALLLIEETGEVFAEVVWAGDSRALRRELERRLYGSLRVLHPLICGGEDKEQCVYCVMSRADAAATRQLQPNREATRLLQRQGLHTHTLYGPVFLISRGMGRTIQTYSLSRYLSDFWD